MLEAKTDGQFRSVRSNFEGLTESRSSLLPAPAAVAAPGDQSDKSHTLTRVRTPLTFAVAALLRHVKTEYEKKNYQKGIKTSYVSQV